MPRWYQSSSKSELCLYLAGEVVALSLRRDECRPAQRSQGRAGLSRLRGMNAVARIAPEGGDVVHAQPPLSAGAMVRSHSWRFWATNSTDGVSLAWRSSCQSQSPNSSAHSGVANSSTVVVSPSILDGQQVCRLADCLVDGELDAVALAVSPHRLGDGMPAVPLGVGLGLAVLPAALDGGPDESGDAADQD